MKSSRIGLVIFWIGIAYMVLVGWLASWWYVPDYRSIGPEFISGSTVYRSFTFNIAWALSTPVGAMLTILGIALSVKVQRRTILYFIFGSIVLLVWLAVWYVNSITSTLYGVGGGIIICCFAVSVWSWAKKRQTLDDRKRLAGDLHIISNLFLLIAAWGLCGLLGTPVFGLRPELMLRYNAQMSAYTLGAKIMTCLIIAWFLSAMSQHVGSSSAKE